MAVSRPAPKVTVPWRGGTLYGRMTWLKDPAGHTLTVGKVRYASAPGGQPPGIEIRRDDTLVRKLQYFDAPDHPVRLGLTRLPLPVRVAPVIRIRDHPL